MPNQYYQLKKGQTTIPFWGTEYLYSVGRDLLGLQTASLSAYTTLVPGITNLTYRIRYYGFYCWLLEAYAKNIGIVDYRKQRIFIRRAEYQLALITMHEDDSILRISGSNFANGKVKKLEGETIISLKEGADLEKNKAVYFKNPVGAFGQYYVGAMRSIGLVFFKGDDYTLFVCSNNEHNEFVSGRQLAKAYGENIPQELQELFLENIEKGTLNVDDMKALFTHFSLVNIPLHTEEWRLYKKLLMQKDEPHLPNNQSFRKETILTILNDIEETEDQVYQNAFINKTYEQKVFDDHDFAQTLTGWYYYELNEYWHFSIEMMFYAILEMLRDGAIPIEILLERLSDDILTELSQSSFFKENGRCDETTLIDEFLSETMAFDMTENELTQIYNSSEKPDVIATASILLLLKLIRRNSVHFDKLKKWAIQNGINTSNNDVIDSLQFISNQKNQPLKKVIKTIIYQFVINQHLMVAYSKMGITNQSTLKFTYENNQLQFLEIATPTWTSPRMNTTWLILEDLQLVYLDEENVTYQLTEFGEDLLDQYI